VTPLNARVARQIEIFSGVFVTRAQLSRAST
jgi:hypothetical protein